MYLTPKRFTTLGLGNDLSDTQPIELRAAIARSTAAINGYCAVPRQPVEHDFRGGTILLESHQWYIDQYERPHPFQFWPWHQPVVSISEFAIFSTNEIKVEIDPSNLFINNSAGYVEISSLNLTQFGIFGAGIVPLLGLYNPIAKMSYVYGHRFPVVGENLDPVDGAFLVWQMPDQFLTTDPITVHVNGSPVTPASIDRIEGTVTFGSALSANDVVTADYTYSLHRDIAVACGLITAHDLDDGELRKKGLGGVVSVRNQEIEIRRTMARSASAGGKGQQIVQIPPDVEPYLLPFVFQTAR